MRRKFKNVVTKLNNGMFYSQRTKDHDASTLPVNPPPDPSELH